jgi:hypothetical protein
MYTYSAWFCCSLPTSKWPLLSHVTNYTMFVRVWISFVAKTVNIFTRGAMIPPTWYIVYLLLLLILLLLLPKRYNLYKFLARSNTFFQLSLFCAKFFQLRTSMLLTSSKTSSSQRILGLPVGRLDMGLHRLIFWAILSSVMRSTCPSQFNICF